jgi:rfaE bifunctional protein kinase chain/domain
MTSAERARLLALLDAFPQQTVLVVSDFVADEFVAGEISRVSREAPVLILRHRESRLVPGGGANAVNNLVDLGARVLPVAVVGQDQPGRELLRQFRRKGVDVGSIEQIPNWNTATKTRFLARWTHTSGQQVLRVDREPAPIPVGVLGRVERKARSLVDKVDAILFSDYGLGIVTPDLARRILGRRRRRVVTIDSRHRLLSFAKLGISAATPNEPELEEQYHTRIGSDVARLVRLGEQTRRKMDLQALLVTRGKDGMVVFERGQRRRFIPIYGADEVADVTGAGDTVISVFTLALAAGGGFYEAALLANYAGGIVVTKRGTATVNRDELAAAIRGDLPGP